MMRINSGEKVWTVVIELAANTSSTREDLELAISDALDRRHMGSFAAFKIMETIDAPYGPAGATVSVRKTGSAPQS